MTTMLQLRKGNNIFVSYMSLNQNLEYILIILYLIATYKNEGKKNF